MIRMHRRVSMAVAALALMAVVLTGCTSEASNIGRAKDKNGSEDVVDTGFTLSTVGSFDSADTAVVLSTDLNNKAVSFINMNTGKSYTLYYDGTTYVKDKHDGPMTISQIKAGDVVDVTFLKGKKKLASIKRSPEAWVYDDLYNYDLTGENRTAMIGSQKYSLPDSAVVLSEGRRVEAGEVVSQDVVTISGINHKIYSVNVERGHGYLRLKNEQPLLGGWIEVGNSVIRQITEDMLLTVPEGTYQVVLSNNNVGCVKEITVERGKEVVLDVGDLEVAEDAVGKILFTVEPEGAKVSVDGKPVDITKAVELKYGIHQIQAEANGYDTLTKHIQVGSEYATISFKLEESRKNDGENSVSGNSTTTDRIPWQDTMDTAKKPDSVSGNNSSSVSDNALGSANNNKVYIDSPKDVEVYLDGNYIGLSPVRFTKTVGRHEITLKKTGYKTKTYTIYLENTKKDETYSFSALEKINTDGDKKDDDDNSNNGTTAPAPLLKVEIKPGTVTVEKGQEVAFEAQVSLNDTDKNDVSITWGLVGQKSEGTKFKGGDEPSTLTVASDESAESLTVTATYSDGETGQTLSGEATVTVIEKKTPEEVAVAFLIVPDEAEEKISEVIVDGKSCGTDFPEKLSCEEHKITVKADGYETCEKVVTISENRKEVELKFEKISDSVTDTDSDPEDTVDPPSDQNEPGSVIDEDEKENEDAPKVEEESNTENNNDGLITERVEITKEAHPIKKWFSSLFR